MYTNNYKCRSSQTGPYIDSFSKICGTNFQIIRKLFSNVIYCSIGIGIPWDNRYYITVFKTNLLLNLVNSKNIGKHIYFLD